MSNKKIFILGERNYSDRKLSEALKDRRKFDLDVLYQNLVSKVKGHDRLYYEGKEITS